MLTEKAGRKCKNFRCGCTTETTVVRAQQQSGKNKVENAKKRVKNSQKRENRIGTQIALYIDIRTKVHKISKLIIGSFTIVVIENGMIILGVSSALSEAIEGIILVAILITTVYCSKVAVNKDLKITALADQESIAESAAH